MEERARGKLPPLGWLATFLVVAVVAGASAGGVVSLLSDGGSSSDATPRRSAPAGSANERAVVDAVNYALPSVVTIINEQPAHQDDQGRLVDSVSVGSGVIIDQRGFIVTNEHVIHDPGKLKVVLNSGEERPATVVSHDAPFTDLAVVRIPGGGLQSLAFGDSGALVPGQTVVAIGSALFEYRNSVTVGVVSGLGRRWLREGVYMEDLVQTDAAVNSGNSGGPLINLKGEVVGLTTNVVRRLGSAETVFGISFAISSQTMRPIAQSMIERGRNPRPYFGIEHMNVDEDLVASVKLRVDHGALVTTVIAGSPAQKAGIRAGDVILRMGKYDVDEDTPFINALSRLGVSDKVSVQLFRDGRTTQVDVEMTPR